MSCATTSAPQPHALTVSDLTLDEKIGQMFVADGYGVYMSSSSAAYRRLDRLVRQRHVGGIVWFAGNVYEQALLTKRLQASARVPLLIASDMEAGPGMRFADTWYWTPAMGVAATGDPSLAEREGAVVARQAKAAGINWILAPVADVNVAPDNPVINARSFGEDPQDVARYVAAFIRGVHSEGLLTSAKHYPGHGDTQTDSHRALPILDVTRERLDRIELVPFRAAVAAGVDSVMAGHLAIPSIDPTVAPYLPEQQRDNRYHAAASEAPQNATLPATISKPILDILRRDIGYEGLIVTDAFDMGGLSEHFDAGEAAVRAIEAGEDIIMMPTNVDAAMDGVKQAIESGRVPMSRIDASVDRILAAKARIVHAEISPEEIFNIVDSEESRKPALEIATKALTLVREESGVLPIAKSARVVVVAVSDLPEMTPLAEVDRELKKRLAAPARSFAIDGRSTEADVTPIMAAAKEADVILFGLAIRARSGSGHITMSDVAKRAIESMRNLPAKQIAIAFGTPYLLREVPWMKTYICAYGPQPVLQLAVVHALFGETRMTGRLPVTIPGYAKRGEGITR